MHRSNRLKCQAVSLEDTCRSEWGDGIPLKTKQTMFADDFDDETALSIAFTVLDRDITSFNCRVLFPGGINYSAFENR
jgi:hypothetical protein